MVSLMPSRPNTRATWMEQEQEQIRSLDRCGRDVAERRVRSYHNEGKYPRVVLGIQRFDFLVPPRAAIHEDVTMEAVAVQITVQCHALVLPRHLVPGDQRL